MALTALWLPILASAVVVFIISSIIHMALTFHKGDYKKLPGEDAVLEVMRNQDVAPGGYMFPCAGSMKAMASSEMITKYDAGPVGFMNVVPSGVPNVGKSLLQWFLYSVVIGIFTAYAAALGLDRGADAMTVFRVTAAVAVLGYAAADIPSSIWKGQRWACTMKFVADGVVYGVATGATFAWLWPAAA